MRGPAAGDKLSSRTITPEHLTGSALRSDLGTLLSGAEAGVLSARGGALLSVLSAQLNAASVQAVETTEDYLLLFCRYPYKSGDEIIHIELFSPVSFLFLRSILGCSQDHISQVCVSREGSHVVAFCPSTRTGLTELLTWNLETEGHKHITRCPAVLTGGVCLDLRTCVGFCRGDKNLLLWDPSSSIRDQTLIYNVHKPRRDGTKDLLPVGRNCRYAVCLSARPGLVSVWNLSRPRYSSGPIRVHHGLYSSSDVVLIQDFRLHILTDRSTNRGADCFQTVLVYDLMKKSYVRRQTGLSVVVCPQQDYRLLQDGRTLLGLSEIRDHVILWDLESGSIKQELKPTFRETLRLQTKESPHGEETLMLQDVRTESRPAREKCWSIEKYILSGDQKVLVCSYFAGHLTVFSVQTQDHTHTLQDQTSVLSLHTAAVTHTGSHLVLPHYDQEERAPRVTLWDLHMGTVSSSMKVGVGVCCVALSGDALRVIFGVSGSNSLEVWEPLRRSCRSICGHRNLKIRDSSELHLTESGDKAVLLSDDLSLWDVDSCSLISVLSLDSHVSCMKLLPGPEVSVLLGLSHSQAVVSVKLTPWTTSQKTECEDPDLFGESSSSEEEEEEEEDL